MNIILEHSQPQCSEKVNCLCIKVDIIMNLSLDIFDCHKYLEVCD